MRASVCLTAGVVRVTPLKLLVRSVKLAPENHRSQGLTEIDPPLNEDTHAPANEPPPPPPSRLRRALLFAAMGLTLTTVGFAAATLPSVNQWQGLLSPPTDAETLALFRPPDAASAAVEAHLQNHPLVSALRARPEFVEARPHLKIPPSMRMHHLTSGLLTGPGRLVVPPLAFLERGGRSMVMVLYVGGDLCGHPGVVHGGALATLVDEGLARCCFQALPNKIGMTANLTMNYRRPIPSDTYLVLRATTTKVEGRKAWVDGRVESLPAEGEEPTLFVEASGLFIEPKGAKQMAMLYPPAQSGTG